jgi:hypothetical protein
MNNPQLSEGNIQRRPRRRIGIESGGFFFLERTHLRVHVSAPEYLASIGLTTRTNYSLVVEESVKGTVDDFLRYFRLRAPAHINEGLHAAGLIPAAHLVQHNTSRVLDEAISQILTEYSTVSSQGNMTSATSAVETQESTNMSASPPQCSSSLVSTASVTATLDTSLTRRSHATGLFSFDNTHDNPPLESTTRLPQSNIEPPRIPNIPPSGYYSNSNSHSWNLPSNPLDPIFPQTWIDWQLWDPDGMLTSTG